MLNPWVERKGNLEWKLLSKQKFNNSLRIVKLDKKKKKTVSHQLFRIKKIFTINFVGKIFFVFDYIRNFFFL